MTTENNTINLRIQKIRDFYASGNNSKFAEMIGSSEANVRNYINGTQPKFDFIAAIAEKFAINYEWLLFGRGNMIKRTEETEYSSVQLRKLRTDRTDDEQSVPLYDLKATAGAIALFGKTKVIPIDFIRIPGLPKCDGAVPITGDSMYPLLKAGDIVMYKEIHDKSVIIWGEMYLLYIIHNGDEYFFTKYVHESTKKGYIKLVSENRHHAELEFPVKSVQNIALVKASVRINQAV